MPMNKLHTPLLDGLLAYIDEKNLRFHMPGHYGKMPKEMKVLQEKLFELDLTEVEGTDNLADPKGIIRDSQESLSKIYGSQKSYYLVNGSTSGIHIAIDSLVPDGGTVLVARNSHKSVGHIIRKKNIRPVYLYPEMDQEFAIEGHIKLEEIQAHIQGNPSTKPDGVILTYPTYYGGTLDIQAIYAYLKAEGIPLIVDAAHGAHFVFSKDLPDSATAFSDISIMSLHKTIPAFTQSSIIHAGRNLPKHLLENLEENMRIYQTSSPSYLLMTSSEISVALMEKRGAEMLSKVKKLWTMAKEELEKSPDIQVYNSDDFCKLFVKTPMDGEKLSEILRKDYQIQCEMSMGKGVLFMLGITHEREDIHQLTKAVKEILCKNKALFTIANKEVTNLFPRLKTLDQKIQEKIRSQRYKAYKEVEIIGLSLDMAEGMVAAEDITPYPPGIPIIMEFEIIDQGAIELLKKFNYNKINCYEIKSL